MSRRRALLPGAVLAALVLPVVQPLPVASSGASAAVGSFLLGRPRTRSRGDGVFEVTARGNNARERRSSLEMAIRKAAQRARRENRPYFAVLRERTGTWRMGSRSLGDETTLRFRVLTSADPVQDETGNPARLYRVSDVLDSPE